MKKTNVEENELKDVLENCNWYEKIIFKIFCKEFVKFYKMGISFGFNNRKG